MAMSIGAKGIDLEKVQVHPTGLVDPKEPDAKVCCAFAYAQTHRQVKFLAAEALRGVGGLLLDNTGSRFVDELQHRDFVTNKMWENNKVSRRLCAGRELTLSSQCDLSSTASRASRLSGIASTMSVEA